MIKLKDLLTEGKITSDVDRAAKKIGIKFKKKVKTKFTNDFTGVNEPGENVKYDDWMDYAAYFKGMTNFIRASNNPFEVSLGRGSENQYLLDKWKSIRNHRKGYIKGRIPYQNQGSGKIDLYQLFLELSYQLINEGGKWTVYDFVIEEVSLIRNYRSQFSKIIKTESYGALVAKLVKKIKALEANQDKDSENL